MHARRAGYEIVEKRFYPATTFLPRPVDGMATRIMTATDTGMQLEVWLRKPEP